MPEQSNTVLYHSDTVWIVVSYSYVLYSTIPEHVYCRIAHMATPAPRCSCCHAQRKSRGPEGHGDGNVLVLLLRNACFRLPHCRPAHSCRPSKEGKALASACGRLHGRQRCPTRTGTVQYPGCVRTILSALSYCTGSATVAR
jgi:hypothetical protein